MIDRKYYTENFEEAINKGTFEACQTHLHNHSELRVGLELVANGRDIGILKKRMELLKVLFIVEAPYLRYNLYTDGVIKGDKLIVDFSKEELEEYGRSRGMYDLFHQRKKMFEKYTLLEKLDMSHEEILPFIIGYEKEMRNLNNLTRRVDQYMEERCVHEDLYLIKMQSDPNVYKLLQQGMKQVAQQ